MSYSKILIKGKIEVVTGLHIGGTDSYSAIGAVDSPVIRDTLTGNPIIPGSSLKGKMRFLLQKTYGAASSSHDTDNPGVLRLFGRSSGKNIEPIESRLKFKDCFMDTEKIAEMKEANVRLTEVKTENTIDRQKAMANPRQIERVVRGSLFDFEMIYDFMDDYGDEIQEDFKNISKAMRLLESDYLGGHGSRGSGRIKFRDLEVINVYGDAPKVSLEV